ncbi:unnamed protein product [Brassica oleracea var. botrytis]
MDDLTRMIIVLTLVIMFARGSDASAMQKTKFGAPLLTEKIATNRSIIVDIEGKRDYTSVQKAIDAVPVGNSNWIIVHVRKGIYKYVYFYKVLISERTTFSIDQSTTINLPMAYITIGQHLLYLKTYTIGHQLNCEIFVVSDKRVKPYGSITAHHIKKADENTGYVFIRGKVYGIDDVYLGRAKGPYSRVIFAKT